MNSFELNGKIALVTGASRGIGAAVALKLAQRGALVAVNYNQSRDAAHAVVAEIEKAGGRATAIGADIAHDDAPETLISGVERAFGGLDILVNNAGMIQTAPLADITRAEFDAQFATNVRGLLFLTQRAAQSLNDGGRIINISSVAAAGKFPTYTTYAATKAAVHAFTNVWARELGSRGITVNSVSPGPVETEMMWQVNDAQAVAAMAGMSPLNRVGQPDDIAEIVAFLASDAARWITSRDIISDGGLL